jgi:hypothetical protein
MPYKIVAYMRIDPEEPEIFTDWDEAQKNLDHFELMSFGDMNFYRIEECDEKGNPL